MKRTSFKYFDIYMFLFIFLGIALICGFLYYNPSRVVGTEFDNFNFMDILNSNASPFFKDVKLVGLILISSFIGLLLPYLLFKLFLNSFSIGFLFHFSLSHGFLFSFLYSLFYFLIPFLIIIILLRVGVSIFKNIVLFILRKNNYLFIKVYLKKYIILSFLLFGYELLLFLFSGLLNDFLFKIIK